MIVISIDYISSTKLLHGVRSGIIASYQIPAIEAFDFSTPTEWPKWIRCFERFRNASGIADNPQESQIDILIFSMGDKADDILQSFNLSEENLKATKQ